MQKKQILIINGPNINLIGERETSVYGTRSSEDFIEALRSEFHDADLIWFQSNVEGELINCIQKYRKGIAGMVINAGGYTHTSVAIADSLAAVDCPVVEVHLSNIAAREDFRRQSLLAVHCVGMISGFGWDSYRLAVTWLMHFS